MAPHNPNPLFVPKKSNQKRPPPDPSTNSRISNDNRSPPPPPFYKNGSTQPSSSSYHHQNNRNRQHLLPPPPPAPAPAPLTSSSTRNDSLSSSSTSSHHQHALQSRGLSIQSPSSPFPSSSSSNVTIDETSKQKLESVSTQFLQLFRLQSQSLESLSSSTQGGGTFEASDLGPEEAEELKRLWNDGLKKLNEKDKREREILANSIVDGFGGLLTRLVERVGGDAVERRIGDLKRQIELLRSNSTTPVSTSTSTASPSGVVPTIGKPVSTALTTQTRPDSTSLSEALARIKTLELKLAQSDQERSLLKKELKEKDDKFEQRLQALENKTTDPRRRVSSSGGGGGATNGTTTSASIPILDSKQQVEIDGLKKEVEDLRGRVAKAENVGFGKRKREEEEEEERHEKEKFRKLQGQVGDHEIKLRDTKAEFEELLEKIISLGLPPHGSEAHPIQLLVSLRALSHELSTLPRITELESSLLRGIHEFLSLTQTSTTRPIESYSPEEIKTLLRDNIFNLYTFTEKAKEKMGEFERGNEKQQKQLTILWEKSKEMKPLLEYFEKLFRKAFPNESAETTSTPSSSTTPRPPPTTTNGNDSSPSAVGQTRATTSTSGGDQSMATMEESEEDDGKAAATVARQLGVPGVGRYPTFPTSIGDTAGGARGQTSSTPAIATTNGTAKGFAHESSDDDE